jgi:bifunctional oligoribonuclease and PAP phosphatase NrnA
MEDKLEQLIEASGRILITSHISPDGDSVSSSLLLHDILEANFPGKHLLVAMEEEPFGLDFLGNYGVIVFQPLPAAIRDFQPDLMVILDSNALHRVTRTPEKIEKELAGLKLAVIDHHEGNDIPGAQAYINNLGPAVTLDVYDIFLVKLGLKKPDGYAQTALTGIYTDTGGFIHGNLNFGQIFTVVPKLIADGADVEKLANNVNRIGEKGLQILDELLSNVGYEADFTYSRISDETAVLDNHEALVQATEAFRTHYLRNVKGRPWGFIVYKDVMAPAGVYSVSLRAVSGEKDVSIIAARLGGGGHKGAAGAKFTASSVEEALDKVKSAIAAS